MSNWRSPDLEIKVGVSACLLGEGVRYDGGHKRDAFVTDTLGRYVTNVLQHLMGFFKDRITASEKRELLGLIDDYARGLVPLVVPITLVNHYAARFDRAYVRDQVYLRPLILRNHV